MIKRCTAAQLYFPCQHCMVASYERTRASWPRETWPQSGRRRSPWPSALALTLDDFAASRGKKTTGRRVHDISTNLGVRCEAENRALKKCLCPCFPAEHSEKKCLLRRALGENCLDKKKNEVREVTFCSASGHSLRV